MRNPGKSNFLFFLSVLLLTISSLMCSCNPAAEKDTGPSDKPVTHTDTLKSTVPDIAQMSTDTKLSISENIEKTDSLSSFYGALKLSELSEMLKRNDSLTIFVPNNAAVRGMPAGGFGNLLNPALKNSLLNVLRFHVVKGVYPFSVLARSGNLKTIEGKELQLVVKGKQITLNGASIILADGQCSNGIIHLIDAVLLPRKPGKLPQEE